jgi:hypothetical protein
MYADRKINDLHGYIEADVLLNDTKMDFIVDQYLNPILDEIVRKDDIL